ncbi:unnamed protein product [Pleuronectes platessa]|uniref:Uncharacterized protein n=1 Tax=Pleuronectes platessa TaxID=8262 RepID=A0A9N7VYY5_PLEPL|nr:unnamed protein product [Pleuronectes platessa]
MLIRGWKHFDSRTSHHGFVLCAGSHRATQARQRWKQQMFYYSDLSAKHLATEAKEDKSTEESSRTDVVAYRSPLSPIRDAVPGNENQMSLDLDSVAEYSALEEISDEEAIAISVPAAMPPASTSLRDYVDKVGDTQQTGTTRCESVEA